MTETPSDRPEQAPGANGERPSPAPEEREAPQTAPREREVTVRSAPSIVAFMVLGLVLGLLVALFSTLFGPPDEAYTGPAIFGILAVIFGTAGVLLGALVALLLDWRSRRRAQRFRAVRGDEEPRTPEDPAAGGPATAPEPPAGPAPERPARDPEDGGSR
ncbi:hypothetical protein [Rothia halotolerans]|uniref:hypothetical protein n=1 Tax=Rothia halotolerans TaxID=405770 RepID=UPI001875C8DF|nr:hypothetical protein [Rothia halotolerans]